MISSADLQFDNMEVDIKLAQEYIQKNNAEFHCICDVDKKTNEFMYDTAKNKIFSSEYSHKLMQMEKKRSSEYILSLHKLHKSIVDNEKLFCQLEYLIRKKPIQTTLLDLKMIERHIRYQANINLHQVFLEEPLVMKNDTPLIELGFSFMLAPTQHILASENTAVLCHLFVELCQSSGLSSVRLSFSKNEDIKFAGIIKNKVVDGGCVGVVTAQSDIESAVNVFLAAPKGDLWGFRRILVQESACERFKSELTWKTRLDTQKEVDPQLKSLCTDLYVYDDKIFLREYVGSDLDQPNIVLIEPFRTVKELITLIESYQPFCVSLWSHGVAESNEIAFGITAPMVWVNRYGTIGEPAHVSLAYYAQIVSADDNKLKMVVQKLQKDWVNLTVLKRQRKLLEVSARLPDSDLRNAFFRYVCCFESQSKNFVHVGKDDLVIGVRMPLDVYGAYWESAARNLPRFIHCLCSGSGFLIKLDTALTTKDYNISREFLTLAAEAGLPIITEGAGFDLDNLSLPDITRVIHSNFGTVFAN